jgi:uncharacterized small protein (DUF1192 family)
MLYLIHHKQNWRIKLSNTLELVVQELQNRIGQMTSEYETKLAVLKAQATEQIQARDKRIIELEAEVDG